MGLAKVSRFVLLGVLILHTVGTVAADPGAIPETQVLREGDARWRGVLAVEALRDRGIAPDPIPLTGVPGLVVPDQLGLLVGAEIPDEPPPRRRGVDHGWDAFTGSLNPNTAAHLLSRAVIGSTWEEIQLLTGMPLEDAVDYLMQSPALPAAPDVWVDEPLPDFRELTDEEVLELINLYNRRGLQLKLWWMRHIIEDQVGVTETMVHFWHDHFANEFRVVNFPQSTYRQNQLFREHALGNARELVRAVAKDPSMILYLDGFRNVKNNPNENFARELMELFTMGVDGGYTQTDVEEVARACTGWTTDALDAYFVPNRHDYGLKTVLGQTGSWDLDDVIDIIFQQPATAEYLADKLYRWFLDDEPGAGDIQALASILRTVDYEIEPVVRIILSSEQMLEPQRVYGSLIRDGLDVYAGQIRRFHVPDFSPTGEDGDIQTLWAYYQMIVYGHILMDPPNVAGWPGHRTWINTYTMPWRKYFSQSLIDGYIGNMPTGLSIRVMDETHRLSDPNDALRLVDDLALLMLGPAASQTVKDRMLDELLQGAEVYNWSMDNPTALSRLRDLYGFVMRMPEYQLK